MQEIVLTTGETVRIDVFELVGHDHTDTYAILDETTLNLAKQGILYERVYATVEIPQAHGTIFWRVAQWTKEGWARLV